ncbi:hypothetical protein DFQ27_000358 [Actinomortierella ambigua]|uniref:Protein SCAI n=1 Tax=Actinomortierella ambigua TaxID=1343610 RepID=A0A9P6QHR1_9FUNG|nr:hypothetical protein DFQ27_000358 [Actinomortierella ambigua]
MDGYSPLNQPANGTGSSASGTSSSGTGGGGGAALGHGGTGIATGMSIGTPSSGSTPGPLTANTTPTGGAGSGGILGGAISGSTHAGGANPSLGGSGATGSGVAPGSGVAAGPTSNDPVPMEDVVSTNAVTAEVIARQNQAVVEEFQYLLEKSQQLFAGLRDLPPTGAKQWQPYFQKTFEVFTKLWKFQQQNRFVLENSYGLKRWEVGEIASKIGQLYYHYYLRTSETNYLHESYVFYEAIRERRYFNEIADAKSSALMIKKLRYYARFTVVCLLLNNRDITATLKAELGALINEYITTYRPPDAAEWNLVLQEVSAFTEIKFSELTIDMYRMLQSLERESTVPRAVQDLPAKDAVASAVSAAVANASVGAGHVDSANASIKDEPSDDGTIAQRRVAERVIRRSNPHKYLLYRPAFSQLMVYLATAFKEVSNDAALLIYISADGSKKTAPETAGVKGYQGGILTNSRKATDNTDPEQQSISHTLHPGDLLPFTRKPMFLIVDSNNSTAFADMPRVFNHPFMSLLSPIEYPPTVATSSQIGGLFTLFLHAPLLAFSHICGIEQISPDTWEQCSGLILQAEAKVAELMAAASLVSSNVKSSAAKLGAGLTRGTGEDPVFDHPGQSDLFHFS